MLGRTRPALEPATPRSRFGSVGDLLRRSVFRAVRPVIFAEHRVHVDLARAIAAVGSDLESGRWSASFPEELIPAEVVDLESDVGSLFLHRDDTVLAPYIAAHGVWEREEADFLRATLRPGHTFLDVGANVGYMTLLGARSVGTAGQVIAVDPDRANVRLLRANLWRNGASARVLPLAAYSRVGFIPFVRSEIHPGDHQVREGSEEGVLIPCSRLDELLGNLHVDVAKIDTQGVDHEVLEGMAGLLRRNPAMVVLTEFWLEGLSERGVDPVAVLGRYGELGFAIGLLTAGGGVRPADAQDVIDACRAWEGLYVNLVLTARGQGSGG